MTKNKLKNKTKESDTLKELENLLQEDVRNGENKFRLTTLSRLFLLRVLIRFTVYLVMILLLYILKIFENFSIVLLAIPFFIFLEFVRHIIMKKTQTLS